VILFFMNDLTPRDTSLRPRSLGASVLSTTLDAPVENVIVLVSLTYKEVTEKLSQIRIIRFVVETKSPSVVQKYAEFVGKPAAEEIRGGRHLLLHDTIVFLLLCSSFETLPWQSAAEEVHENVSQGLKVITTGLLDSQVGVDGCITSSASEILVLPVGNVEMCFGVTELLGETEIDNIDLIASFANAHEKVVGLYVPVNEISRVYVFDTRNLRKNGVRKE
jgi:hypothetical protein